MRLHASQTSRLSSLATKLQNLGAVQPARQRGRTLRAQHASGPRPWEIWRADKSDA